MTPGTLESAQPQPDHTLTLLSARLLLIHALQVFFCSRSAVDVKAAAEAWQQQGLNVQVDLAVICELFAATLTSWLFFRGVKQTWPLLKVARD